ncbi:MAG: 4-hydroxythreonine-4-phosphate dehydrogenase PdxA [Hyphomonadaceae bacterium]
MGGERPLAVTMGDPAGVGPIITWEAWRARRGDSRPFLVIAPPDVLAQARGAGAVAVIERAEPAASAFADSRPGLPLACATRRPAPGAPDPATAPTVIASIETAVRLTQRGECAAVVTNPISKALLYRAGFQHPGHTEFLAQLSVPDGAPAPRPVMMLCGGGLRVALVTIHERLTEVPSLLSATLIEETAEIVDRDLRHRFGLRNPRIGLCGLNPHAGEDGEIGDEEVDFINPAAANLREMGMNISDARPGDTIFHEAREGRFDAVIAMYHDQGLIPVKTLDLWGGVNVTLGLPFIRTSPDHGVAYDVARAGNVHSESLIAALDLADQMARATAGS